MEEKIGKDNIELVIQGFQSSEEKDQEFLNSLWKYVLFSENFTRILPTCVICNKHGEFEFDYEGLGGIKRVGNGIMHIPITEQEVYAVPDVLFHYFFTHNAKPTEMFRNAVLHGYKPNTNQYREIVKKNYYLKEKRSKAKKGIKCPNCGKAFEGFIAYKLSRRNGNVRVYKDRFVNKIFNREQYIGVCINCLHNFTINFSHIAHHT